MTVSAQSVVAREVLLARAYLSRVAEPPAPALAAFVEQVGAVEAADRVRAGAVGEEVSKETAARRTVDRAAADLAAGEAAGARLLIPEHPEWPHWALLALTTCGRPELAPPVALWARGPAVLDHACEQSVGMVGARAATNYGVHLAGELAAGVAEQGFAVASGAAVGIDGAAHRGALATGGTTVAVLACGVDRAYPASHEVLLSRIAATGLVVSEYPPGCVPGRHRFLVRNRLIAGLSCAVLVVEAGLRSGAQRTAADAAALGRPVLAVPGPITSGMSAGCHRLIQEGALLVTRAEEVLEAAGRIGRHLAAAATPAPQRPTDGLDDAAVRVHDALPARAPRQARWLAMEAGLPIAAVREALVRLERRGLVEHGEGHPPGGELWRRPAPAEG